MRIKLSFLKKSQLKIRNYTISMFSIAGFRFTSSTINEIIGFDMKTEFLSEINLVNAGLNEKGFFLCLCRTAHNLNLCEMTIVFSDSQTCYWQDLFLL